MSQVLTYEIPDEIYATLEQVAAKSGRAAEAVVLEYLARQAEDGENGLTEEERRKAGRRFEKFIGMVNLGPTGADNESIDRDLAAEHGGVAV